MTTKRRKPRRRRVDVDLEKRPAPGPSPAELAADRIDGAPAPEDRDAAVVLFHLASAVRPHSRALSDAIMEECVSAKVLRITNPAAAAFYRAPSVSDLARRAGVNPRTARHIVARVRAEWIAGRGNAREGGGAP